MCAFSFFKKFSDICLIGLLIALTSCEGNTRYEVWVSNQSEDQLRVEHRSLMLSDADSVIATNIVPSGEIKMLFITNWLGGIEQPAEPGQLLDSMALFNEEGMQSLHPWRESRVWLIESHHDRKIPSQWRHVYILRVGSDSFE